jgi:CCR4-NOT transcription complex subunit 7/8
VLALLKRAGINFDDLSLRGIEPSEFVDCITSSGTLISSDIAGLILNEDLKWIVFHGGFDFGYLIQMFHHSGVPHRSDEFQTLMNTYFPQSYDLKFSLKESLQLKDVGLSKLAYRIKVTHHHTS